MWGRLDIKFKSKSLASKLAAIILSLTHHCTPSHQQNGSSYRIAIATAMQMLSTW